MESIVKGNVQSQVQSDDQVLVLEAVAGNQQAFAVLLERYRYVISQAIARIVQNPSDTDDLTMEVFSKAFSNLHNYRPHFAFSTWLYRIAINHAIDYIRKKRIIFLPIEVHANNLSGEDTLTSLAAAGLSPEELYIQKQQSEFLHYLLGRLNPRNRSILLLHYFEGYSYEEIAKEMGVPIGTVKAQLHRAREALSLLLLRNRHIFLKNRSTHSVPGQDLTEQSSAPARSNTSEAKG
ncbi:MAG: RNA polymerase sigma factor [Haliscomenobacter sp.]